MKWDDNAAIAGRCQTDAAIATTAMPMISRAYPAGLRVVAEGDDTHEEPGTCQPAEAISSQPTPNIAMHTAMTQPQ